MTGAGRTILHLSADYPDPLMPQKTRAVAKLKRIVLLGGVVVAVGAAALIAQWLL